MTTLDIITFAKNIVFFYKKNSNPFLQNQFPQKKYKLYLLRDSISAIKLYLDLTVAGYDNKQTILAPKQADRSFVNQLSTSYNIAYFDLDPINFNEKIIITAINSDESIKAIYLPNYLNKKYNLAQTSKICEEREIFIINDHPHSFIETAANQSAHANIYPLDTLLPLPHGCLLVLPRRLLSDTLEKKLDAAYGKLPTAGLIFYFWPLYTLLLLVFRKLFSASEQKKESTKSAKTHRAQPIQKISAISENYINNLSTDLMASLIQNKLSLISHIEGFLNEIFNTGGVSVISHSSCFLAIDANGAQHQICTLNNLGLPYLTWPNQCSASNPIDQPASHPHQFILFPLSTAKPFTDAASKISTETIEKNCGIRLEETTDRNFYESIFKNISNSSLLQDWMYGEAKREENWCPKRYVALDGPRPIGIVQVLEKRKFGLRIARINRGPLATSTLEKLAIFGELKKKYNMFNASILLINPEIFLKPFGHTLLKSIGFIRRPSTNYHSATIDLTLPLEKIRSNLDSKWRNLLKNSESKEIAINQISDLAAATEIIEEYDSYQSEKGFSGASKEILFTLLSNNLDNLLILSVTQSQNRIGTIIIYIHGSSSTYLIGMSNSEGRKLNVNNLLLWRGIELLQRRQIQTFDLGGMDEINLPQITHFKRGLNGKEYNLCGEWL
jgi:hypothetical protein